MRYISQIFQPILTIPKNAKVKSTEITCKSQKLLLECGLIRPTSSGFFALLPLARRALDKLEALVTSCLESAGAQKVSLPALTAAPLWQRTGRLEACATELLTVTDRHDKKYILSPTHEEAVADLMADIGTLSHKQLPLILYQISNKYRDEHRPKHGLLRAREFLMADAYSFHESSSCAEATYSRISLAYRRLFQELNVPVHRVVAPTGDMGGSLSHEWHVVTKAGEDRLSVCGDCGNPARADEADNHCAKCGGHTDVLNSVEVGHTFILGTKYSEALDVECVTAASGALRAPLMACYGVGLTRLAAACVEHEAVEKALRWPLAIAPYTVCVIGPKEGSKEWSSGCHELAERLCQDLMREIPVLTKELVVDDRHQLTIGKRMLHADRTGFPFIIVCGKSALEDPPRFELQVTSSGGPVLLLTSRELVVTLKESLASGRLIEERGKHEIRE